MRWILVLGFLASQLAMANDLTEWQKLVGDYRTENFFRCTAINDEPLCNSSAEMGTSGWLADENGKPLTGLMLQLLAGYSENSTMSIEVVIPAEVGETQVTPTGLVYKYDGPLQANCGAGAQKVEAHASVEVTFLSSDKKQFRINAVFNDGDPNCSGTYTHILTRK